MRLRHRTRARLSRPGGATATTKAGPLWLVRLSINATFAELAEAVRLVNSAWQTLGHVVFGTVLLGLDQVQQLTLACIDLVEVPFIYMGQIRRQ
jgi:hypothetical protein